MLEKPGAQNIAAFENQGKHCEISDHWKSIETLFLKENNMAWWKKRWKDRNASFSKKV